MRNFEGRRGVISPSIVSRLLFSLLAIFLTLPSLAQQATESQVKAAYLYNFGKFVRWQPDQVSSADSIQICVLGRDPFGQILDATVAGENIDNKKIVVRRMTTVQETPQCRILFVSASEEHRLRPIITTAQRFGELTVSDIPNFAEQGGIIEFVTQKDKIRFEVNRAAAEQSHLVLSSQLLKVATKVIEAAAPQSQP